MEYYANFYRSRRIDLTLRSIQDFLRNQTKKLLTIDLPEPLFTCDTGDIGYTNKYLEVPECLGKRAT